MTATAWKGGSSASFLSVTFRGEMGERLWKGRHGGSTDRALCPFLGLSQPAVSFTNIQGALPGPLALPAEAPLFSPVPPGQETLEAPGLVPISDLRIPSCKLAP